MTREHVDLNIDLDGEGYLRNFEDWNENVACALADKEGVSRECPLTLERMEILKFMRKHSQYFVLYVKMSSKQKIVIIRNSLTRLSHGESLDCQSPIPRC
jgi:sulfur relay (sulfurtransferase) DsrC/TusE family protein